MGMLWGSFAAQVPVLKDRIGAGDALFGGLLAMSGAGLLVAILIAPVFDRRFGARSMQVSAMMLAVVYLSLGIAQSPVSFAIAIILAAGASGLLDVLINARVSELEGQHRRSLMNVNHGMFSLAYALGAFSTGLAREAGWPPVMIFAVLGGFVLALSMTMCLEPEVGIAGADRARLPWMGVIPGGLILLIAFQSEASVEAWSALHIERTLGGRAVEGAFGPTMLGLTMAAGRFAGQAVGERIGNRALLTGALLISAIGTVIAGLAPTETVAYIGFGIVGLGISVLAPTTLAMVGVRVGPGPRAYVISRVAVIGFSAFFIGPAMMGLAAEFFGLRAAFAMIAGLLLLALLPLAALSRQDRVVPA